MIECIFTIDYEIYGNGEGSLGELVIDPAEKLKELFRKHNSRYVIFADVAELEMIEAKGADPAINRAKQQLRNFYLDGYELGLHIHPAWYNGRYENGEWILDYSEYNLCALRRERIIQIINRAIAYYRNLLNVGDFSPLSYRAGHLLFQPTKIVAGVLAERGIKVDSSLYKGGIWHQYRQDYRRAVRNGYYWKFNDYVDIPDPEGTLLEVPIYTRMIPTWKMFTSKRMGMQKRGSSVTKVGRKMVSRVRDYLRLSYPLKLDICNMTMDELARIVDAIIHEDEADNGAYRPIVAIGHTKEIVDLEVVDSFLSYLKQRRIAASSFERAYALCGS